MKTKGESATLTLQQILFGDPERRIPDEMVMREITKAGDKGMTLAEVSERLLGRELTKEELELVVLLDAKCDDEDGVGRA